MNNPFEHYQKFEEHREWISEHISKTYSENEITVFHEILSLDFHLDVYFIQPEKLGFNILLTSGMSSMKMKVEEEVGEMDDLGFAELMLLLSKDIQFDEVHTGDQQNDWIISLLKQTARLPHYLNTWLGVGDSFQANDDLSPYSAHTDFVGVAVLPSVTFEEDFMEINREDRKINIYSLLPLYKNELEYKIENGFEGFVKLLQAADPSEVLDNKRKNML